MSRLRRGRLFRRLMGVALLALVLAQWAALSHGIAHAPQHEGAEAASATDDAWGHPEQTASCQLVDQLLGGQAVGGTSAAVPCLAPGAAPVVSLDWARGSGPVWPAYEARGPPRA